ncbi:MAG: phenylalanyl-tRNA synthetase beta chain [Parcubacteria bacterium C7867-004]|nr:MAG: phenylalanyl-tRNA synthetase beta chain [Parcubacteria bacterium C7867-004]
MKVSRAWLQTYFEESLPSAEALADALTFHAFEIEEVKDDLLDVKVLPDRAAYALSHRGIAKEISAVLDLPLKKDPLREEIPEQPQGEQLSITADSRYVLRHMGALVTGVEVKPSPAWLKERLESVGQRSINNVVDILNYVMLDIGQPAGAFDADTLGRSEGALSIDIREAKEGERIVILTGEEHELGSDMFAITDATNGTLLDIAGIKGGRSSGVTESTTNLFISVGTYDATLLRRAAQKLKIFTDASSRYQNRVSPALCAYGMRDILALVTEIAGGEVQSVVDFYPSPADAEPVTVSLGALTARLGQAFTLEDVRGVFDRLGFSYTEVEETFTVLPPFERRDIVIPEDLAEEVGRILGYDRIDPIELSPLPAGEPDQARYRGIERIRDFLRERGFTELSTPSFAAEGDLKLANPLASDKPFLRSTLLPNMHDALARAKQVAPRLIGPAPVLKLFEIGTIFTKDEETLSLSMGVIDLLGKSGANILKENAATLEQELLATPGAARFSLDGLMLEVNLSKINLEKLGEEYAPEMLSVAPYKPFSLYPAALRDIAVWTPLGTEESEVTNAIIAAAGDLLVRIDQFDRFEKEGRISYAFRLVFESMERTLADTDLDPAMERVTNALNAREGWEVR